MQQTFGKYKLHRRLAFGGMAEVFLGSMHGEAGFSKTVVIKRLHPRLNEDDEFVQMLIDEARITSQLTHSSICQVLDLGSVDGSYYIAMEYVAGEDLRALLDRFSRRGEFIPVPAVLYIVGEMLAGLDYAHRKEGPDGQPLGVIHRDVSPQNVLVSYEGEVKVIDFGIAKARSRMVHTEAGVIKGKFRYMAPEQASGAVLDHRTDVFAAGVVLYELLRGRPHSMDLPDTEVLRRMREATFDPIARDRTEVPEGLLQVLGRALQRRVHKRFASAGAFRDALQELARAAHMDYGRAELAVLMQGVFPLERRRERSGLSSAQAVRPATDPPTTRRPETFDPPLPTAVIDQASPPSDAPASVAVGPVAAVVGLNFKGGRAAGLSWVATDPFRASQGANSAGFGAAGAGGGVLSGTRDLSVEDVEFDPLRVHGAKATPPLGPVEAALEGANAPGAARGLAPVDSALETKIARSSPQDRPWESLAVPPDEGGTLFPAADVAATGIAPAAVPPAVVSPVLTDRPPERGPSAEPQSGRDQERRPPRARSAAERLEGAAGAFTRANARPIEMGRKVKRPSGGERREALLVERLQESRHERSPRYEAVDTSSRPASHRGSLLPWLLFVLVLMGAGAAAWYLGLVDLGGSARNGDKGPHAGPLGPGVAGGTGDPLAHDGSGGARPGGQVQVTVRSRPPGARIVLCGKAAEARTPAQLTMYPDDRCELVLTKPGYRRYQRMITAGRRTLSINATLKRSAPAARRSHRPRASQQTQPAESVADDRGTVTVTSVQVGTVLLSGREVGKTPQLRLRLRPGRYQLKVVFGALGVTSAARWISVNAGSTQALHFDP